MGQTGTDYPLLIAWLVIIGVVYWLATHPRLVAPYASNLVSRHLLRIEEGGLRVRDFRVRTFEGLDLYGVSLTLPGKSGGMTLISADTVTVDFDLREALGAVPHLRRVTVSRPEVYSMAGSRYHQRTRTPGPWICRLPDLIIDHLVVTRRLPGIFRLRRPPGPSGSPDRPAGGGSGPGMTSGPCCAGATWTGKPTDHCLTACAGR